MKHPGIQLPIADVVRLRAAELLTEKGWTRTQLAAATGLSDDRIRQFVTGNWKKISKEEIGLLVHVFGRPIAELFETHRKSFFHGAKSGGTLEVHQCSRTRQRKLDAEGDPLPPDTSFDDGMAASVILERAVHLGLAAFPRLHRPNVAEAEFRQIVRSGSHLFVGWQGELAEHAVCWMVGAPAFDESCNATFAYNMVRGKGSADRSSIGFIGSERGIEGEGIYSNLDGRMVAKRTHRTDGIGHDCGLIAVMRKERPVGDGYEGERRDCLFGVLGGHGPAGTRACAEAMIDEANQDLLYPTQAGVAKLLVVSASYYVRRSETMQLSDVRIVEQAPALNRRA